jgi:molecular chaperone GrpE
MMLEETPGPVAEGPAADADATAAPAPDPRDEEIEALRAQVRELKEQALRAVAESQTIQRRMRASFEEERKLGVLPLVEKMLPLLDTVALSLRSLDQGASAESVLAGVSAIEKQIWRALEEVGVAPIPGAGAPFDPAVHEAVAVVEGGDEGGQEIVADEVAPGYMLHGRVVRPAKVRVRRG